MMNEKKKNKKELLTKQPKKKIILIFSDVEGRNQYTRQLTKLSYPCRYSLSGNHFNKTTEK